MARSPRSTSTAVPTADVTVGDPGDGSTTAPHSATAGKSGPTSAAEIAAARRAGKTATPAPHPQGAAPAAVNGEVPVTVIASQTTVSGFGSGGPARPVGGVWAGQPLVLETSPYAPGGAAVDDPLYVVAECSAQTHTIPPNAKTPVSKTLWHAGMRVRRDLYEAVMAEHAARAGTGAAAQPFTAALPAGVDAVPADTVLPTAPAGATAGTTVATPLIIAETPGEPAV